MIINPGRSKANLCRRSYPDFLKAFWHVINPGEPLEWNWHLDEMTGQVQRKYERLFAGEAKDGDTVTNVSPGTSKSTVYSIMTTPWAWTRMPHFHQIGASYSHPVALELSRKSRDIIKSDLYRELFPEIRLRDDMDTMGKYGNTLGGMRYAVGSRGSVTGMHGHVITIDDPINPEQSVSEVELQLILDWITRTLSNRWKNKRLGFRQLVMQRLTVGDPTDLLLRSKNVEWLCLPATLEFPVFPPDLAVNYRYGLMDPDRLPQVYLDEEKKGGDYYYAGQYGQSPIPAGGGLFKTNLIRFGRQPARFVRLVRFWDRAATPEGPGMSSRRAAYTVGVLLGEDEEGRIWVLDVVRVRLDTFAREALIKSVTHRDGHAVIVGIEQEPGSGGLDSVRATARSLSGFNVQIARATGSKETRADAFSVAVNGGNVWIPDRFREADGWTGWAKDYVEELKYWPFSRYKDQGDASGGAYSLLAGGVVRVGPLPPPTGRPRLPRNVAAIRRMNRPRRSSFVSLARPTP